MSSLSLFLSPSAVSSGHDLERQAAVAGSAKLVVPPTVRALLEGEAGGNDVRCVGGRQHPWHGAVRLAEGVIEEKKLQLSTILLKLLIYIFLKMLITIIKLIRLVISG